jgi:O-antigen/teichoic acid export membrane protein
VAAKPADTTVALGDIGTDEVRSRATSGAALLGARGVLIYVLGIGCNLVLAHLLAPRDFGLVALGTVLLLSAYLVDGGLGASLIRRAVEPSREELQAVLALEVAVLGAVTAIVVAGGALVGRDGLVVATMVASLPIVAFRAPTVIVLERRMRYRPIATADVAEAVAYYTWAVIAVALGAGVWGMATAVIVRAIIGTATVIALGPGGLVLPRWSWRSVRPLIGFGAKFQATSAFAVLREQMINVAVAAVAGLPTLGIWNLSWRVLQVPALLFNTVARVGFPAMSRLLSAGQDARPYLERGVASIAVMTGVMVVGLTGSSPALPRLLGAAWGDVPAVILWSSVAIAISAPIVSGTMGYLFAAGAAGTVALATLVSGVVWCAVAIALLPTYGAPAVGLAWVATAIVNARMLWKRTAALTDIALGARWFGTCAVSLAALAAAWLVGRQPHDGFAAGALGLVAGEVVLLAGLLAVNPAAIRDARALVGEGLRTLRPRSKRQADD